MWKEITEFTDLVDFANLRNNFGCSVNYTAEMLKCNIENKIDCKYFIYNGGAYKILIGFKYHQGHKMLTLMTFAFIVDNKDDYPEVLTITMEKIKETMTEKNMNLINEYDWLELQETNFGIGELGYWNFFGSLKEEGEKIGLKVFFDDNKLEVSL